MATVSQVTVLETTGRFNNQMSAGADAAARSMENLADKTEEAGAATIATEEKVTVNAVPEAVRQRTAKLFKDTTGVKYERSVVVLYEVVGKGKDGKKAEFLVDQAGVALQEITGGINEEKTK